MTLLQCIINIKKNLAHGFKGQYQMPPTPSSSPPTPLRVSSGRSLIAQMIHNRYKTIKHKNKENWNEFIFNWNIQVNHEPDLHSCADVYLTLRKDV